MRADFNHTLEVNNRAAMHPLKCRRIELRLKIFHGDSHHVGTIISMNTHIITGRIYPVDVFGFNKGCFTTVFDRYPFRVRPDTRVIFKQLRN